MLNSQPAARKSSKPKATKPKAARPVAEVLASPPGSLELIERTKLGATVGELEAFRKEMGIAKADLAKWLLINLRTLQRKKPSERLPQYVTERLLLLRDLFREGIEVFGSLENFQGYLNSPIIALGLRKPKEFLDSLPGVDIIRHELVKIEYSVY